MNKLTLLTVLLLCGALRVNAQGKILAGKKVDYDKMSKKELAKTDQVLSHNMDQVLGFGLKLKVVKVEKEVSVNDVKKEKNALRFQIGLKLPQFIKTDPPDKVFKLGWDFGVVK